MVLFCPTFVHNCAKFGLCCRKLSRRRYFAPLLYTMVPDLDFLQNWKWKNVFCPIFVHDCAKFGLSIELVVEEDTLPHFCTQLYQTWAFYRNGSRSYILPHFCTKLCQIWTMSIENIVEEDTLPHFCTQWCQIWTFYRNGSRSIHFAWLLFMTVANLDSVSRKGPPLGPWCKD